MSYNGIGLSTARGSGTNGYVVRNLGHLRVRRNEFHQTDPYDDEPKIRKPNAELVLHEQKRSIEVKCATLQDELEDEGVDEQEIDRQVGALREKLTVLLEKATAAAALAKTRAAEREAAEQKMTEQRAQLAQERAAERAANISRSAPSTPEGQGLPCKIEVCVAIRLSLEVKIQVWLACIASLSLQVAVKVLVSIPVTLNLAIKTTVIIQMVSTICYF
ncbi:RNA-splicing factor [Mortierella claussenii]|nr:RNA-splicing factor [Mortierella claussenii]